MTHEKFGDFILHSSISCRPNYCEMGVFGVACPTKWEDRYRTSTKYLSSPPTYFDPHNQFYILCWSTHSEFSWNWSHLWLCYLYMLSASRRGEAHPNFLTAYVTIDPKIPAVKNNHLVFDLTTATRSCEPRNRGWGGTCGALPFHYA